MSSPAWLTSVMPCRSSVNCTPVAFTGVGVVELLVMVTVVVTISPGSITPSPSVSKPGVATVLWMAVKVSLAMLAPLTRRTSTRSAGVATATHSTPAAAAASGN